MPVFVHRLAVTRHSGMGFAVEKPGFGRRAPPAVRSPFRHRGVSVAACRDTVCQTMIGNGHRRQLRSVFGNGVIYSTACGAHSNHRFLVQYRFVSCYRRRPAVQPGTDVLIKRWIDSLPARCRATSLAWTDLAPSLRLPGPTRASSGKPPGSATTLVGCCIAKGKL